MSERGPKAGLVDAGEAARDLDRLLDRAEQGERLVVTRDGRPVARLVPCPPAAAAAEVETAIAGIEALRRGTRSGGLGLRELIEDGRRF